MPKRNFIQLFRWEFEEYLKFPILEIIVVSTIILFLYQPINSFSYYNRHWGLQSVVVSFHMFATIIVSAITAHSFAGSLAKNEIKTLLSYPVKRWQLFLSKFTVIFSISFLIYFISTALHLPLLGLNIFDSAFLGTILLLFLQLLFVTTVTVAISVITKSEIMSIIASVLLILGVDMIIGTQSMLSSLYRLTVISRYFSDLAIGQTPQVLLNDLVVAIIIPLAISFVLFSFSFLFFTKFMELD